MNMPAGPGPDGERRALDVRPPESRAQIESQARAEAIHRLLARDDDAAVRALLADLHPSDIADLVEQLEDVDEQVRVLELLPVDVSADTLSEIESHEHPEEILSSLDPRRIAELLAELPDDDAVDLIGQLSPEEQARVLATLPLVEAGALRRLLRYDEESAGGIMTTELVSVDIGLSAAQAIEEIRRQAREMTENFYAVYVVDEYRRLKGTVGLQDLVIADPGTPIAELLQAPVATVPVDMDQEHVARLMARYNLPSMPVLGPNDALLGRITFDDVLDVIEAEQTEDMFRLAGVSGEEEVRGGVVDTVRARLPWLMVTIGTASLGASVVWFFQDTIGELVLLAAVMPVIAGIGGNAGTQALAVTVRRLALSEESSRRRWGLVAKEIVVGLVNGLALGIVAGVAGYLLADLPVFGLVVLLAMWGNLVVASVAGAFVPVLLERMGADPAVASAGFVTACTDVFGFFLLLGLASALIL
ncbi:MAG TPA: magnesium transporter [Longimicrobiales bacterium]|nr:magnesium transporter [Longimicrobiales bacterium]